MVGPSSIKLSWPARTTLGGVRCQGNIRMKTIYAIAMVLSVMTGGVMRRRTDGYQRQGSLSGRSCLR